MKTITAAGVISRPSPTQKQQQDRRPPPKTVRRWTTRGGFRCGDCSERQFDDELVKIASVQCRKRVVLDHLLGHADRLQPDRLEPLFHNQRHWTALRTAG